MASIFKKIIKRNSGFTLLEMTIVLMLFTIVMTALSIIYINLTRAALIANDYYQSLENVRLGTEKLWRVLKYGWNFNLSSNSISFKRKDCTPITVEFDSQTKTLIYTEGNSNGSSYIFDPEFVKVNNIIFASDRPLTNQRYAYFQYAPKIIVIYYDLEIKSKKGLIAPLKFQQAVAPLNSTYSSSVCP